MHNVLIKVYGTISPLPQRAYIDTLAAGSMAMGQDEPWLFYEENALRFAFEGVYFPDDDVLSALEPYLGETCTGILDVIDMENWTITRRHWRKTTWKTTTRSLNDVLASYGF